MGQIIADEVLDSIKLQIDTTQFYNMLAFKQYELTNHLGNVLATVSDRLTPVGSGVDYYKADVSSAQYYYPFGSPLKTWESDTIYKYSFGFNGEKKDDEAKGKNNQIDYGLRVYDPRIGKFLSVDILENKFPYWSPYHFAGNNPIRYVDLDGAEILDPLTRWFISDAALTLATEPTSAKAKVYGVALGVTGSVGGAVQGTVNLVTKPLQSAKGIARVLTNSTTQNAVEYAVNLSQTYSDVPEPIIMYAVTAHVVTDFSMTIAPMIKPLFKAKGLGSVTITQAADDVVRTTTTATTNSPKALPNPYYRFTRFETKYGDHAKTFGTSGTLSRQAYYNRAIKLADAEIGGDIMGFTTPKGTTFKLNAKTGEFIVINPDGQISTFYRRIADPVKYLETQKQKYGVKGDE